jgi:HK97 family phage prohead protease
MPNKFDIEQLKAMPKTIFRRAAQELRFDEDEGVIDGYPIVFNKRTQIGDWFYEEIDERALDGCDLSDIKFLVNHEDNMIPLARHRRGKRSTMDIQIDNIGLKITARLDIENNATAKELFSAVKRGDIEDMSFAFDVEIAGEEWADLDKDMPIRRITKFSVVREVSAVNDGAYPQTYISARSATLDNEKKALDNARAASLENEKRQEQAEGFILVQKAASA